MNIRFTDITRELIAAGLHGAQLVDALGRIEACASNETAAIIAERRAVEPSGQPVITRRHPDEPEIDEAA